MQHTVTCSYYIRSGAGGNFERQLLHSLIGCMSAASNSTPVAILLCKMLSELVIARIMPRDTLKGRPPAKPRREPARPWMTSLHDNTAYDLSIFRPVW